MGVDLYQPPGRARLFLLSIATLLLQHQVTSQMALPPPTLLDRMNLAKDRLSPACVAALPTLDPTTISKANFATGRIGEGLNLLFTTLGNVGKVLELGPPTDLGNPDLCHSPTGHLQYCQVNVHRSLVRWGACIPQQCTAQDIIHALFPPGMEAIARRFKAECEDPTFHQPSAGTYAMVAFTLTLVLLAVLGTWVDHKEQQMVEGQQPQEEKERLPSHLGNGEETKAPSEAEGGRAVVVNMGQQVEAPSPLVATRLSSVLRCFSLTRNARFLLAPPRGGDFDFFDGIRVLSILWIIYGHLGVITTNFQGWSNPVKFAGYANRGFLASFMGMVMRGGLLAVDSFFFMSGFLACLTILRGLRPTPQSDLKVTPLGFCQRVPLAVVRRYLRLTPVYAFVIFAYTYFAPAVTEGPFVDGLKDTALCKTLWWQNLLYVNNLMAVHNFEMCMSHSWFLGIDMQFFLLVPFLAGLAVVNEVVGLLVPASLIAGSLALAWTTSMAHGWQINPIGSAGVLAYADDYHIRPQMRAPVYLLAVLMAIIWYYHEDAIKKALRPRPKSCVALLTLALLLMAWSLFGAREAMANYPAEWSQKRITSYLVLANPCWGLGVLLLSLLLMVQHGVKPTHSPTDYLHAIKTFLEARPFTVLSRLVYTAYLVHKIPLLMSYTATYASVHFSGFWVFQNFFTVASMTLPLTIVLYLLVEKPFDNLMRWLQQQDGKKVN